MDALSRLLHSWPPLVDFRNRISDNHEMPIVNGYQTLDSLGSGSKKYIFAGGSTRFA